MAELNTWEKVVTNFELPDLNQLASDGVQVSCINSSDFVVGRQTNFNGPVTIINCENPYSLKEGTKPSLSTPQNDQKKEEIVIRDKVLSESASAKMQKMANGKASEKSSEPKFKGFDVRFCLIRDSCKIPNVAWIILIAIFIAVLVASTLLLVKQEVAEKEVKNCLPHTEPTGNSICIYNAKDIRERTNASVQPLNSPVPYVVISETDHDFCFNYKTCIESIEYFQQLYVNLTPCNFFVGGDGSVYEYAGWNTSSPLSGPAAGKSIDICLMGNFVDYPTYPQMKAAKNLIDYGLGNHYIAKNYILMSSNATTNERKVSSIIYGVIKKWPRFSDSPFLVDESEILKEDFPIIPKESWGGLPPTSFIDMKLPVPYVVISHSVTVPCYDFDACSVLLQSMQKYHMSLRFADIGYNFMVDSNGVIYEGRGWSKRNVAGGFINGRNVDINFIGDFSKAAFPTTKQLNGVKYLIHEGLKRGKIAANYSLIAANATFSTLSPGKNVYEVIKTWPHFDPDPEAHVKEFDGL